MIFQTLMNDDSVEKAEEWLADLEKTNSSIMPTLQNGLLIRKKSQGRAAREPTMAESLHLTTVRLLWKD